MRKVFIAVVVLTAFWFSRPRHEQPPVQLQTIAPLQPIPEITDPESRTSLRIIRKLKLPERERLFADGSYLINYEQDFRARLGEKNQRYLKWNNVDFGSQSVLIFAKQYPGLGIPVHLRGIYKTDKNIVLCVEETSTKDIPLLSAVDYQTIGVVVPKISGPLRTEYRVVQVP